MALIGDPRILIRDEPGNGLDPAGIAWLRSFTRGVAKDGRSVLVSSHLLSAVKQSVDDVVIVDRGRLVALGPLADLLDQQGG
jgi:ABC-2 type transport system ATP-binding protein